MKRAKVGKEVEEAICKIGREEVHLTVPLGDTEHIVLFFGVDADVEICHTDGDELVLTGTKSSIGFSEEEARASVEKIQVLADQVESWLEVGPHPGEVFSGTWHDEEGHPEAYKMDTSRLSTYAKEELKRMTSFLPTELYPEISTDEEEIFQTVDRALNTRATRITVIREKLEDIVLPRKAYTEAVRRVFVPNWTSQDLLHGPIGRVDLVLAVPVSKTITVLGGGMGVKHVRIRDLRSDVNLIHCYNVELSDVRGNVCLLDSSVKKAHGIRGRFLQSFYEYGGTDWSDHKARRKDIPDSTFRDITGEIRVDLGRVNLEASDLKGKVYIRNRFGTTRFHLNSYEPESKYRIESDSGEVLVFLKEDILGEINLTVNTLCGTIKYDAFKDLGELSKTNDLQLMTLSTITSKEPVNVSRKQLDAELCIKTRDGDVTIEKTM